MFIPPLRRDPLFRFVFTVAVTFTRLLLPSNGLQSLAAARFLESLFIVALKLLFCFLIFL